MKQKNEIYSIRKFKVGVGSALIGLSFLGATGLVNDVPVIGDVFGVEHVSADENESTDKVFNVKASFTGNEGDSYDDTVLAFTEIGDNTYSVGIPGYVETPDRRAPKRWIGPIPDKAVFEMDKYSVDSATMVASVKPSYVTTTVPKTTEYVKDDSRAKGEADITEEGVDGVTRFKQHYATRREYLDGGSKQSVVVYATDKEAEEVVSKMKPTIVKVAAKDKVTTKEIAAPPVRYEADNTKDFGTPNVETKGKAGQEVTTTIYSVDSKTGNITEKSTTERTQPTETVIKVATKTKVVTKKDDQGRTVTETTTYTLDTKTGKVTPTTVTTYGTTKDATTTKKAIPSPVHYEKDATREKGQPNVEKKGKAGEETTTTTYAVDPKTGNITPTVGKPVVTTQPTETVIKVAAKDKVVEKELPSRVRYVGDENKENSTDPVRTEGKKGKEVTTTTYAVDPKTGNISESTKTERTEEPTDTVITIGTKPKVELIKDGDKTIERTTRYKVNEDTGEVVTTTTDRIVPKTEKEEIFVPDKTEKEEILEPEVVYEKDASREKGSENITIPGTKGKKVTPISYEVEEGTGKKIEKLGEPVITPATETVIKVAAKDKVVEKELPSHVRYVGDENKENSTDPVRTEGKKGKEVTTTTYAVDLKTGTISESTKTERTEEPTDTVVTIGTKPKVELIKDGNRTIERTTRYKVNEDTGEVVTTTTDKLIPNKVESSNGDGELPPVVDVPEFNGGVNGDLDGNAAIHDVPEYTGPLAGNGLTGEGEMVEPPVVDVPEFDLNKLPKEVKEELKQEVPNVGTGLNTFNDGRKKPAQATEIVPVASTKEEPKAETPKETKDVSTPVTLEQKNDEQGKQAPVQTASSKKEMKELPNTGTASNAALTLAGVTFAMFGIAMIAKKKD